MHVPPRLPCHPNCQVNQSFLGKQDQLLNTIVFAPCSPGRGRGIVRKLLWFGCCGQRRSTISTYGRSREGGNPGRNQEATRWNNICGGSNRRNHRLGVNVIATTKDVSTVINEIDIHISSDCLLNLLESGLLLVWPFIRGCIGILSCSTFFSIRIKELEVEVCRLKCEVISLIQASIKIPLKGKQWKMTQEIFLVICVSVLFRLFISEGSDDYFSGLLTSRMTGWKMNLPQLF